MIKMEKTAANSIKTDYENICRFIPQAMRCECGWGVQAFLPSREYGKFLKEVAGKPGEMERRRTFIDEKVNNLLEGTLKPGSKVLVGWFPERGAYFNFEDSCTVGVPGEDAQNLTRYTSCNIDSPQQALMLQACLYLLHEFYNI